MESDNQQEDQSQQSDDLLTKLQEDLNSATNNWKRTAADFENFKKRKEAENKELVQFAREVTVAKLLPTLDSLEQALKHMPEYQKTGDSNQKTVFADKYQNWQTGVNGIIVQLDKALEELGVKKIEAVGKKFDPHFHEALRQVDGDEDDMVVEEFQTGFELNGKVIRPSQVIISKKNNK